MQNFTGFYTLARKETKRVFRIWRQTLIPPMITTVLYFFIFGKLIGTRIGDMDGVSYMQFIAPGLIMMSAITAAYGNTASSFFLSKYAKHIEELLVSPLSTHTIIAGYVMGSIVRAGIIGVLVTSVAFCFVSYDVHSWLVVITIMLMTITMFALAGLINAIYAKSFDEINLIPTFILTPLTYLGGVFYSISLLSDFWQGVSKFNPIMYMINGFRYGFLGISDVPILYTFAMLSGFILILYSLVYYLIEKGIGLRS
ncbi:Inner membrane transport permease yadH [Phocoenobacter uteri]|uniref:Transport permease protein n=1 Tax=Phocoenobacter uteri TaxID=146806 RepID=A0A379C8P9_9PAST|nr:ABC transporter permease [Phocoenobacter uteri]MDG6882517.1 ABC transporter permease [Phocoenobacter uteri]SUB58680.1 Inner membrane transport permease yadH [Phocoenobacter uteri]